METLDASLRHSQEEVRVQAFVALEEFSRVFHKTPGAESSKFVEKMLKECATHPVFDIRRGYSVGLSAWSKCILESNLDAILQRLQQNCAIHKAKDLDDSETRKSAVTGLRQLVRKLGLSALTKPRFELVLECCYGLMEDYKVDRRGDVGSVVREKTMYCLLELVQKICTVKIEESTRQNYLSPQTLAKIVGCLLQQLVEKIDRMRLVAGSILQTLFDSCSATLPDFPQKLELVSIFGGESLRERVKGDQSRIDVKFDISLVDTSFLDYAQNENFVYFWNVPQCVFPLIMPLCAHESYTYFLLRGVSLSAGGITLSTHKEAVAAIINYIDTLDSADVGSRARVLDSFVTAMQKYRRNERFLTPLFNCLTYFFENDQAICFETLRESLHKIAEILHYENMSTKKVAKLTAVAGLVCELAKTILLVNRGLGKAPVESLSELRDTKLLELMAHLLNHE